MKIQLVIFSRNDDILHITETLKHMGHEVRTIYADAYRAVCPYYKRRLDKMGFDSFRLKWERRWLEKLNSMAEEFAPDRVLFVNTPRSIISAEDLAAFCKKYNTACWLVDGLQQEQGVEPYLRSFNRLFTFEKPDVAYIKNEFGLEAEYCPVGFNDDYAVGGDRSPHKKDIDIVFVGTADTYRLKFLDRLSRVAKAKGWKLALYGNFYQMRHFWKKFTFGTQYPVLVKYVHNGDFSSKEVAELYHRSKICLNIHVESNKDLNPRTFEILGAGALELVDTREDFRQLIPGKDLVVYKDEDDMIAKIDHILSHYEDYQPIIESGHKKAMEHYSMHKSLEKILAAP